MKTLLALSLFAAFVSSSAFAADACDNAAKRAAAEKIRETREFHSYPSPYIYSVTLDQPSGGVGTKVIVSFGDASGSDTAEDASCTVYLDRTCSVHEIACNVH